MKKQILVVDDDLVILKLLNFVLIKEYNLVVKNNGIEALKWLEEGNDPALIISDIQMPFFDGHSFIKNLKISGFYKDTPVLILSGTENLPAQMDAMPFKVDGCIKKPFNPTDLKEKIQSLLSKHDSNSVN
jgi:two-component system chemotaxis response regulator CheY